ncbi:hypothetical protein ACFL6U_06295 [Planctomycetota bacterium]
MAKRKPRIRKAWSPDEIQHLKRYFRNYSTAEIADELGRSRSSVQGKASCLGLLKTHKYLKSIGKAK